MTLAIPTQPGLVAGSVATATDMNNMAAQVNFLLNKPYARAQDVSGGAVLNSNSFVTLTGVVNINVPGSGQIDNNGMINPGSPGTGPVAQTPGWYRFRYCVVAQPSISGMTAIFWATSVTGPNNPAGSGVRSAVQWPCEVTYNGTTQTGAHGGGLWPFYMYAGDFWNVQAAPSSGGHLTTSVSPNGPSFFEAEFVSAT